MAGAPYDHVRADRAAGRSAERPHDHGAGGRRRRRGRTAAVGLFVGALVPALAASAAVLPLASASTTKTTVKTFSVYGANGRVVPGLKVPFFGTGYCWTGSLHVSGAYRCFLGNQVHDPCFAHGAKPDTVVCVASPWSTAVEVVLKKKLPKPATLPATSIPWAVQLANGTRCVTQSGTTSKVAQVTMVYSCTPGLAGAPHQTTQPWTLSYASSASAKQLETEAVATAWK
jgi:hypothetical protein